MKWLDKLDDQILAYSQKILIARAKRQSFDTSLSKATNLLNMGTISIGTQKTSGPRADFNRENNSLNFTLHPAQSGYILELSHYDPNHDRYLQRLHIINDTDDMGDAISKIITLELLRR